jgi:hypothetical protein
MSKNYFQKKQSYNSKILKIAVSLSVSATSNHQFLSKNYYFMLSAFLSRKKSWSRSKYLPEAA